MAGNSWKGLEMSGNLLKWLEMDVNEWNWLELADDDQRFLELAGSGWRWLRITIKMLERAGYGWNWHEQAKNGFYMAGNRVRLAGNMSGNGWKCLEIVLSMMMTMTIMIMMMMMMMNQMGRPYDSFLFMFSFCLNPSIHTYYSFRTVIEEKIRKYYTLNIG